MLPMERLFDIPILGKAVKKWVLSKEGGLKESETIRRYFAKKHNCHVDLYSYGGCFDPKFNLGGTVRVGKYCSFATDIRYFGANHPVEESVLTAYFYNRSFGLQVTDVPRHTITFGNDVWVGYGAIFTSGCHRVGNGAVIAAGAVVTRDVEPYAVVAGTPAKSIKYRFDQDTIDLLEASQWWELPPKELFRFYDLRKDPKAFARAVTERNNTATGEI